MTTATESTPAAAPTSPDTTCTCRTRVEQQLLERFQKTDTTASNHNAHLEGYKLCLSDNRMYSRPAMEVRLTADYPTKAGPLRFKTKRISMLFSFCPFCGSKFEKGCSA